MFKKMSLTACAAATLAISASVSADIVIKSGTGQTQSLPDASVQTLISDGLDWEVINSSAPWDTQLGHATLKAENRVMLSCGILGKLKGFGASGEVLLRHIITCNGSRLNTDDDVAIAIPPSAPPYCEFTVHETMKIVAPMVNVPPNPLDPLARSLAPALNSGIFQYVTGGTIQVTGTVNVCTGINTFSQISGRLTETTP